MKYTATAIKHWDMAQGPDWRPLRPMNHVCDSIFTRIRHAFGVLVGRYDALDWQENEPFVAQPSARQDGECPHSSAVDHLARVIYEQWAYMDGYVPWVDGGNSLKQGEARKIARDARDACDALGLHDTQSPLPIGKVLSENEMAPGYDRRMGRIVWFGTPAPGFIYAAPPKTEVASMTDSVTTLPDGSAAGVLGLPLPKNHWLLVEGRNISPMPFRTGTDGPRVELAKDIEAAARYAIRASTVNGKEAFDPDALVQNLIVGLLGYNTPTGLCGDSLFDPEVKADPNPSLEFAAMCEAFHRIEAQDEKVDSSVLVVRRLDGYLRVFGFSKQGALLPMHTAGLLVQGMYLVAGVGVSPTRNGQV